MLVFLLSIFGASLLGSLHCAGMCGPFLLGCVSERHVTHRGGEENLRKKTAFDSLTVSYSLGRLITYLILGAFAGYLGKALTTSTTWLGFQSLISLIVGTVFISMALWKLYYVFAFRKYAPDRLRIKSGGQASTVARIITGPLGYLYSCNNKIGRHLTAVLVGLLTTWIPCGWLYAFVGVAAASSDASLGMLTMLVFWVGTLPVFALLSSLVRFRLFRNDSLVGVFLLAFLGLVCLGLHWGSIEPTSFVGGLFCGVPHGAK